MRVLIVGCGYVGLPLGAELARQGHQVCGVRRSDRADPELKAAGIQPLTADVTRRESLNRLPTAWDWVVNVVASTQGGAEEYRQVYREGTRNLIDWLSPAVLAKYVYTSSIGVYGQDDGSEVTEESPTAPATETGKILVETEALLFEAARRSGFPAVVLRAAGIYGPTRGHLFRQFLRGEARISGHGWRILNMIHRDDLVGIVLAALARGRVGEAYNAVDNEPVFEIDFFRWLSERLGKPMPLRSEEADPGIGRRRATNKKVLNRKVRTELAYQFRYPTFREGAFAPQS